jgi:hypothetical protein
MRLEGGSLSGWGVACGWEIFVTNVSRMIWTPPRDVSNAYGLRWRIEIIFKAWKSHFKLTHLTNGSKNYIVALIPPGRDSSSSRFSKPRSSVSIIGSTITHQVLT